MWKRATWHECADELNQVCQQFRDAYWGRSTGSRWPRDPIDEAQMLDSSRAGVQILRALALAVRSEQDFHLVPAVRAAVGVLKRASATVSDGSAVKQGLGYKAVLGRPGYEPLVLRDALNKIAHADPQMADYYVGPGDDAHDLLFYGSHHGHSWFAAVSLPELIKAVRALPDAAIEQQ